MRRLGVNVDHVATLRQARRAPYPDPLEAALVAERAGAHQITVHLRGDRRHIQDHDLRRLRENVSTELNVEAACTDEMLRVLLDTKPHRVTLVEERPGEVTTEGGLDVVKNRDVVAPFAARLAEAGIRVSVFVDPEDEQVRGSRLDGVDMIELNTARYAEGDAGDVVRHARACAIGRELGLAVAAGHGLNRRNLRALVTAVPDIEEYNIGHALIGDAVFDGLGESVRRYLALLQ